MVSAMMPRRSVIGVYIDVEQGDESDRQGARVDRVRTGGPADEAGLREGDVVVRVGEQSVFDALPEADAEAALDLDRSVPVQRFQHLIGALEPEEPVELEVMRDGESRTFTLTPEPGGLALGLRSLSRTMPEVRARLRDLQADTAALRRNREALERHLGEVQMKMRDEDWPGIYRFEMPEGEPRVRVFADSMAHGTWQAFGGNLGGDPCLTVRSGRGAGVWAFGAGNCIDGVEFVALNPELGSYFGTDEGALVAEVEDGSELGLRPGDVLLAVDGREVTDPSQARRILASYNDEEEMRLRIRRQGSDMEVLGRRR
jgi:membrane-associated protease RseP (regulator of RpoE activity)